MSARTDTDNSDYSGHWPFRKAGLTQLNHGSFGACPRPVLDAQDRWRQRFQANPTGFVHNGFDAPWEAARQRLAAFVNADDDGLVFIRNATEGVNTVLASYPLHEGDEVLVTSHGYNACINAARKWAGQRGASVVVADLPFPLESDEAIVAAILSKVTAGTRLALIDHITSPTALILPLGAIISQLHARGVEVLVDGAHAPGQIPLDVTSLQADFYTGNCHKWLCAPLGAAFLWVSEAYRERIDPLVISHGYNDEAPGRSRLHKLFDWTGSYDFTGVLCLPELLDFFAGLHPDGHDGLMRRNHDLAIEARNILGWRHAPASMLGAMVSTPYQGKSAADLRDRLLKEHSIMIWSGSWQGGHQVLRVSCFAYNSPADYRKLASVL